VVVVVVLEPAVPNSPVEPEEQAGALAFMDKAVMDVAA
jgi:hypothetical protein